MDENLLTLAAGLVLLVGVVAYALHRRAREQHDAERLSHAAELGLDLPPSLHPVINPDVCIGSLACVKACPEGDILGIVNGAGRLIHGAHCIGHGQCAVECPVDAIQLVFGTSRRGVDLPEVDARFESSRAGVHVVGELGGMGLIKNAMTQGVQVGRFLDEALGGAAPPGVLDVVVVGAGPAGIATGLALRERKRTFEIVEQEVAFGAIAHYPRRKLVMSERLDLPVVGKLGRKINSKERLIEELERAVTKASLPISAGVRVTALHGEDGAFRVETTERTIAARKVVLATGRRGTPQKLGVPGEDQPHVVYRLTDAAQYAGRRVLVVGGGDSAIEAALQLHDAGAKVHLSYRGPKLARARPQNLARIEAAFASGAVTPHLPSTVRSIATDRVELSVGEDVRAIECDDVLVQVGGTLPTEFLDKVGVGVRRFHGEAPGRRPAIPTTAGHERRKSLDADRRSRHLLALALFLIGASVVLGLAAAGHDYYPLGRRERAAHPLHELLRASGPWGHGVGLAATAVMLANFFYAARKRLGILRGIGALRSWLTLHMFVGFLAPIVIAFHATFQSNNWLATSTSIALIVVVLTGIVGRYLYGLVPSVEGKVRELAELGAELERERARLGPRLRGLSVALDPDRRARRSLPVFLLTRPAVLLARAWRLRAVPGDVRADVAAALRLGDQIEFYPTLRRILGGWRTFHVVLALFLVVAIALHVGVSIYLGYGLQWGAP